MPITIPDGPLAQDTIGQYLSDLQGRGAVEPVGGAMPDATKPLAVYVCGLRDLAAEGLLGSAVHTGWRYLIAGGVAPGEPPSGREVAVADAMDDAAGEAAFTSLTHGFPAQRLVEASAVAQSAFQAAPEDFEARILEIPALNTTALWMHAPGTDKFIPYLEGVATPGAPAVTEDFAATIRARAEAELENAVPMQPQEERPE